jgi:hypothetical protein
MSVEAFAVELRDLGFDPGVRPDGFVLFEYRVPVGRMRGDVVQVGLQPVNYPMNPPPGPHISPAVDHPGGGSSQSPLGANWRYWSRPFVNWSSNRTAKAYMAHIRHLFDQL